MIYRAPERTTPARGRAVTHELAAVLVGLALLAALILQFACTGAAPDGTTSRWLCVNNPRLAQLRGATPTPAFGGEDAGSGRLLPVGGAPAPQSAASPEVITTPTLDVPGGGDVFAPLATATDDAGAGYPGGFGAIRRPTRTIEAPGNLFAERRGTETAEAAEIFATLTEQASALSTVRPASATPTATDAATGSPTPTPGPGTPSVTPGATETATATATKTGYP